MPKYSKTCVKQPLSKRAKTVIQDQLSLNVCLFDLILYVQVNNLSVTSGGVFLG